MHFTLRTILLALALAAFPSSAATVQTLDGHRLLGELKLEPAGQLLLTPPGSDKPIPLDPANILRADFKAQSDQTPPRTPAPAAPARWTGRDIGKVGKAGAALLSNGNLVLQGSGADIGGSADAFHFAYRTLAGDGELTARLLRTDPAGRPIKVGLMMRSNTDPASAYAMAVLIPRSGVNFQARLKPGGATSQKGPGGGAGALPLFIRLKRDGKRFLAYTSEDGTNWQYLGEEQADLPNTLLAGVAVASRSGVALATATFDQVSLTGAGIEPDKSAATPNHRNARGVLFRNGSFLAGQNVRIPDESTIRLQRDDKEHAFTPHQVAAVFVNERTLDTADRVSRLKNPGALINSGDFFEGAVREADRGRVRVSSVIFGPRQFEHWRVSACVYSAASPPLTRYELRLNDGSLLFTDTLQPSRDGFLVDLKPVGSIPVKLSEILELNAGAARFQSLTELPVAKVDRPPNLLGEPYTLNATLNDRALSLDGVPLQSAIALAGEVAVHFSLAAGYRSLATRLAVPEGILPTSPVSFVILADGREVHRTSGRTSLDDSVPVTVDLSGVHTLILRVEASAPSLGGVGLFASPMLVR